jgi:outer membrane protein assembly factor BamA
MLSFAPSSKNSSISFGAGWSQQSGGSVNVAYTKKW